jgi:hypothetical protein
MTAGGIWYILRQGLGLYSRMNGAMLRGSVQGKRSPAWCQFFAAFMILALVVQGYVTQTHIHKQNSWTVSAALKASGSPNHDNFPVNDDPANCPICQQITHAGHFLAPAWFASFLLVLAISKIEIATLAVPHFDSISHNWRSRGPPLN